MTRHTEGFDPVESLSVAFSQNIEEGDSASNAHESGPYDVDEVTEELVDPLASRVRAFMVFRVGVLGCFGLLAAITRYLPSDQDAGYDFSYATWTLFGLVYGLATLGAWLAYRYTRTQQYAQLQTVVDIILAAMIVQHTGGADSGFSFLYLIAIMGSAVTGKRYQCWTAAGTCALIYTVMTGLQLTGLAVPLQASGEAVRLAPMKLVLAGTRTLASFAAVGFLSSHLNARWRSSQHVLGSLRALNENILRSLTSGLIVIDHDHKIRFANPTARTILEPQADWHGVSIDHHLPGFRSQIAEAETTQGMQPRIELCIEPTTEATDPLYLGLSCCPLRDESGKMLGQLINFQDVSALRKLEARMRRSERLAAVGELAATVAHEVRNPLAAMGGCAQLLDGPELSDEQRRLVAVIRREAQRLELTVQELLLFTRPRELDLKATDLGEVCAQVVESFAADPNNDNVRVAVAAPEVALVRVDREQISQVLWNLLRNAREAQMESPRIELAIEVSHTEVTLELRDYGPGIAPERCARIFEPNYTTKTGGNGFGLALALRIIEAHDGSIEALRPTEGPGACFRIRLPRYQTALDPVA